MRAIRFLGARISLRADFKPRLGVKYFEWHNPKIILLWFGLEFSDSESES
jgi:hypothetical protein